MEEYTSKADEQRDLIKYLDPYKTIFYFESKYHAVKNNWLTVIPHQEAEEKLLLWQEYELWNLGDPPAELPESCPSWMWKTLYLNVPASEYLQLVFDAYYQENKVNNIVKN